MVHSPFSVKGDQLQNCDIIFYSHFNLMTHWITITIMVHSPFSVKGDQLQNCDIIFYSQIFGPVFS